MLQSTIFWGFTLLLPAVFSHQSQLNGWNELLYSDGLFDHSLNGISVKSTDNAAVLSELNAFLAQDTNAKAVYSTYRALFKESKEKSPLRIDMFKERLVQIAAHNLDANSGKHSWWMGVNQFTDMETSSLLLETTAPSSSHVLNASSLVTSGVMAPASLNNVVLGKVIPAKDTYGGSSLIFAIIAAIETSRRVQKNEPVTMILSEQQLVDCPEAWCSMSQMCKGSQLEYYLTYVVYLGSMSGNEYRYTNPATKGTCRESGPTTVIEQKHSATYASVTDGELMQLLADKGAAVVSIHFSDTLMNTYRKGVYPGTECGSNAPNRFVTIVGYDSEGGQDYWIIKNSWGQKWGEQGFLKLARNGQNVCGILSDVTAINIR